MGSLWGHIDEGMAFAILALWWIYNVSREYVQSGCDPKRSKSQMSYSITIKGREIPLEIYLKIGISIGGCLIEVFNGGVSYLDEEGNFRKVTSLQHMSIYALFILHGFVDLCHWYRVPAYRGSNYFTMAIAFIWYGMVFYYHTKGIVHDPLEEIIHQLGIVFNLGAAICLIWEYYARETIWPALGRCLMVLSLGTWFIHTPFTLYSTDSFPGGHTNPRWSRTDLRNVHFLVSAFGFHVLVNLLVIYGFFFAVYCCHKRQPGGVPPSKKLYNNVQYSLQSVTDERENGEVTALLESEEEV